MAWLRQQMEQHPEGLVPWGKLIEGFQFEGQRVPLVSAQGIFKPKLMSLPLTVATAPPKRGLPRPYDDQLSENGHLLYCYRGQDPQHPDNVGLRRVMLEQRPLIYLHGIVPGLYAPVSPVYIVQDHPELLRFSVDLEPLVGTMPAIPVASEALRRYGVSVVMRRLHQKRFREMVLDAYRDHCSICRLKHRVLLDAAHILPDGHPESTAAVNNGLALCKLHHAAFDANILGIRPDYVVEIREDVLKEVDGPMLLHGLQGFQSTNLILPRSEAERPRADFLEIRYAHFREAG